MISKSLLFLTIARNTLCESVDKSNIPRKKIAKYWLTNEATDYEIMSLLMYETIPKNPNDIVAEHMIWENFKTLIYKNKRMLSEVIGPRLVREFLIEQGPVSRYGLSSAKPVVESYLKEDYKDDIKTLSDKLKNFDYFGTDGEPPGYNSPLARDVRKYFDQETLRDRLYEPKTYAVAAVIAVITYGAYQLYKNFLSTAARSCSHLSGEDKIKCMNKYKERAIQAQIDNLSRGIKTCSKSKNPAQCKEAINYRIKELKIKITKIKK